MLCKTLYAEQLMPDRIFFIPGRTPGYFFLGSD